MKNFILGTIAMQHFSTAYSWDSSTENVPKIPEDSTVLVHLWQLLDCCAQGTVHHRCLVPTQVPKHGSIEV